jgi:hypothetical protein
MKIKPLEINNPNYVRLWLKIGFLGLKTAYVFRILYMNTSAVMLGSVTKEKERLPVVAVLLTGRNDNQK